jgi:hypothetical protein
MGRYEAACGMRLIFSQYPMLLSESDASRFPRVGAASTTGPSAKTGEELPHCACFR